MKTLIFIAFLLATSACSSNHDGRKEPVRVKGIPEKAFWVGGADGGSWFLVEDVHSHRNNAVIKVYNDNDGSLIASKRFLLVCPSESQVLIEDLNNEINGFDGERILLKSPNGKEGCWLQ
jgi:hypothetical protein